MEKRQNFCTFSLVVYILSTGLYGLFIAVVFVATSSGHLITWCTTGLTFNNCTFCPHCIYMFCIYLRTNSDLCHLQHKLIGFYNRDEKCLQRGKEWVFKYSGLRFVFKGPIMFSCLTSCIFLAKIFTKILYAFLFFPIHAAYTSHLILLDFITWKIFREE